MNTTIITLWTQLFFTWNRIKYNFSTGIFLDYDKALCSLQYGEDRAWTSAKIPFVTGYIQYFSDSCCVTKQTSNVNLNLNALPWTQRSWLSITECLKRRWTSSESCKGMEELASSACPMKITIVQTLNIYPTSSSVHKGTCHQDWRPEFGLQDPHEERRETILRLPHMHCALWHICTHLTYPHSRTNTHN